MLCKLCLCLSQTSWRCQPVPEQMGSHECGWKHRYSLSPVVFSLSLSPSCSQQNEVTWCLYLTDTSAVCYFKPWHTKNHRWSSVGLLFVVCSASSGTRWPSSDLRLQQLSESHHQWEEKQRRKQATDVAKRQHGASSHFSLTSPHESF